MMELTKERLTQIVRAIDGEACDEAEIMGWFNSDDIMAMARQLLAGLEQEPVAYIDPFILKNFATYRAGETDNKRMGREWVWANPDAGLIPLYAAPQLPQPAVVSDVTRKDFEAWARVAGFNEDWYFFTNVHPNHYDDDHINDMWAAWRACRAAMLQGAEPVNQPYTLRDGLVAVPVDMAPEMMRAVQLNSELGAYVAANLSGAYSLFREFWGVACSATGNYPATPEGYVLVPVEPTAEMCDVKHVGVDVYTGIAADEYYSIGGEDAAKVWKAMLAAAPQQEVK